MPSTPRPTGRLIIKSDPSGASILIDTKGIDVKTPDTLYLPLGGHLVTLTKDKFADFSFCVDIEEGAQIKKSVTLVKPTTKPAPTGELKIESIPSHSVILVDLKDTGLLTPETLQLAEGSHLLTLKQDSGYDDESFCVEIIQDELLEKFIELKKATGKLSISSTPSNANIWLANFGEESKDTLLLTPQTLTLSSTLPEELITITLRLEGFEEHSFETEIIKGKLIEKHIKFVKAPVPPAEVPSEKAGVRLSSRPTAVSIFINGKDTKRITPELVVLPPDTYEFVLKKEGYENKTFSVTIEEGELQEKFVELMKVEGFIPSPDKSGVKIVTNPSFSSIYINGENSGRITPELLILEPGEHEITIKKQDYEDTTVSITVEEGKQTEQFIQLTKIEEEDIKKTGVKLVSSPSSAAIFVGLEDTKLITPEFLTLDPGMHEITLKRAGYSSETVTVTIEREKQTERFIELKKLKEPTVPENRGELYIISNPRYAKVYVDDTDTLLITPVLLSLAPATYNITLKRGGYSDVSFTVTIIKGKKMEKFIEFPEFGNGEEGKRIGQLHIESKPQHAEIWEGGSNLELLTPETLTLTPGTKSITLKKSGFDDYAFSIQIVAGEKSEKLCELTKSTGELFLQSRPSRAKIFIDDKDSHLLTPEKLILAPGTRRIGLSFPAFLDALFIVKIVKGGKIEKFHRFAIPRDSMISEDSILDSAFFYTKTRCMKCDESPDYDVLFSDGNIRAWLCEKHCTELVKEQHEKINAIRRIDNGKATNKFRENSNPNVLSRFIKEVGGVVLVKDDENLAPVYPSGIELGEKITREEVLQHLKSFYRTKPFVSLIGGICNRGSTTGDIDVFIRSAHRDLATEFRIIRMFPEKYWFRFQFHYPYEQESHPGVFTNHMDIYDEKIEAIHNPEIVLMSVPKKVELFKFAPLLKPAHGRYKGEEYSIDKLIEVVNAKPEWYEKGTYVQKKFDGVHVRCDGQKNYESGFDVIIWSEEGNDITKNLPTLRKELGEASKGHAISIVGELESWEDEKHQSRQQTTAIIHTKEVHPNEKNIILNAFDCLYYDKDIHNEPHSERLKSHAKIKDTEHIKKAPYTLVHSPTELRKAVEHYSGLPSSEGAYLKLSDFPYELDGKSLLNLKFKNTFSWDVAVKSINKIKGANAWSYLCVIEGEKGEEVPCGKTYNTSIGRVDGKEPLKPRDILKVEFVNLNKYIDPETQKVWYNMWSPNPIPPWREEKKKPDNTLTAEKLVEASKGTVAEKHWPKRYEDDSNPLTLHQNESVTKGKIVKVNDKLGIVTKIIGG